MNQSPGATSTTSPRLTRRSHDKLIAGVASGIGDHFDIEPNLVRLTAREHAVLRHIARGYAYKEITRQLNISTKTVESHVSSVLRKLQLSNRHELTRWATERRIV